MVVSKTVHKTIDIDAPPSSVWHTLTTPQIMRQWLSENGTVTITTDWSIGSPFIWSVIWSGIAHNDKGVVVRFEPEIILQYSNWSEISHLPDKPEYYSILGFELTPDSTRTLPYTTLSFTHSNLVTEAIYKHSNFYWNATLNKIKKITEQMQI